MKEVPVSLRRWFVVHFIVDMIFGLPLLLFPEWMMSVLGFGVGEQVTARLVGAALVGIGGVSLWVREEKREVFVTLLRLKLLWSGSAIVGLALAILVGAPVMMVGVLAIFMGFFLLWWYYYKLLKK